MDRENAIRLYLTGTIGQVVIVALIVFLLRRTGNVVDYTTTIGMMAVGIGGISSISILKVPYNLFRLAVSYLDF